MAKHYRLVEGSHEPLQDLFGQIVSDAVRNFMRRKIVYFFVYVVVLLPYYGAAVAASRIHVVTKITIDSEFTRNFPLLIRQSGSAPFHHNSVGFLGKMLYIL